MSSVDAPYPGLSKREHALNTSCSTTPKHFTCTSCRRTCTIDHVSQSAEGLDIKSDPGEPERYRNRRSSTRAAHGERARKRRESCGGHVGIQNTEGARTEPKQYLNGGITKLHNVRAEPIRDSKVVGFLVATKEASRWWAPVQECV